MILATVTIENVDADRAGLISVSHPDKMVFTYEENGKITVKVKGELTLLPSASEKQLDRAAREFAESVTDHGQYRWEKEETCGEWIKLQGST